MKYHLQASMWKRMRGEGEREAEGAGRQGGIAHPGWRDGVEMAGDCQRVFILQVEAVESDLPLR